MPGQIASVFGTITAKPVRMPADHPQFHNALMVAKLEERYRYSKRGGWTELSRIVWTSEHAAIGLWKLDSTLIRHADFDWDRASPCTDYIPPAGWIAECPGADYAYRHNDDYRMSYQVTPIPTGAITMIAQPTPGGGLTTIESGLSGVPDHLVVWAEGYWVPGALLDHELNLQLIWTAFWALVVLMVVWRHMYNMLRVTRSEATRGLVAGGLWRAFVVVSPLAVLAWPFESVGFMATAALCTVLSAMVGFGLWLRETMDS